MEVRAPALIGLGLVGRRRNEATGEMAVARTEMFGHGGRCHGGCRGGW